MAKNPQEPWNSPPKLAPMWRALVEAGFIVFLYYSNLLMGEFEGSGLGRRNGLLWALNDSFTASNFIIAIASSLVGYVVFEFLRKRL